MSNPKLIPVPFAKTGTRTNIPVTRASNDASEMPDYDAGFPPITSTPLAAGGKAPRRQDFNGVLHDVTDNIRHLNSGGFFTFDAAFASKIGGYPKGAVLLSNDGSKKYVSLIDGNTSDFNVSVDANKWAKTALTEREIQDIAWGVGKTSSPWVPLASPSFTGTPTAPTASSGDSTTQLATTAFVQQELLEALAARTYVSPDLSFSGITSLNVQHNCGTNTPAVTTFLRCISTDGGFVVGDVINLPVGLNEPSTIEGFDYRLISPNAIAFSIRSAGIQCILNKAASDTFIPNSAKWKLIVKVTK